MPGSDLIGYAYALTVTVGGAIGYLKAGEYGIPLLL